MHFHRPTLYVLLFIGLALSACSSGLTTVRGPTTTTTSVASTTTTIGPNQSDDVVDVAQTAPTTTLPPPQIYDNVIYGDSLGALGAAVTAARLGDNVVLISDSGYFGGQAGAAGVSTMDEGGDLLLSGLYQELINQLNQTYGDTPYNQCYYGLQQNLPFHCPDPKAVRDVLAGWLSEANVTVVNGQIATDLIQNGSTVSGLTTASGIDYLGQVADGSEFADLYPLVDGLDFAIGNGECLQKPTWATIVNWYPSGRPDELSIPATAYDDMVVAYGQEPIDKLLARFRARTANEGMDFDQWGLDWANLGQTMTFELETGYRGLGDMRPEVQSDPSAPLVTRTGINRANDGDLSITGVEDLATRFQELAWTQNQTYLYLWYLQYELDIDDWGLANDLDFGSASRWFNNPVIPDDIEQYFTPMPYVRESRRLSNTVYQMTYQDIMQRRVDHFDDSVMLGSYKTDQHGCHQPDEEHSGWGMYDVPIGVFIPNGVDGFLPALARAAGVDRAVSSSIRMQPTELNGGQVVGVLLHLANALGVPARDVPVDLVRQTLIDLGAAVDVP